MRHDLSKEEVNRLVYSYEGTEITNELYSFGMMALSESQDRARHINSRAVTVLTWSTGVLALIFSQLDVSLNKLQLALVFFGSLASLAAVVFSFKALRLREGWCSPSDKDWFEETALVSADELKRFHIRSIHEIRQSEETMIEEKGDLLFYGEKCLMIGAILMALDVIIKSFVVFLSLATTP